MHQHGKRKFLLLLSLFILNASVVFAQIASVASVASVEVSVDATEAPRGIMHVRQVVNVPAGATFDLFYPKWIPGEHQPTGTINNMINLRIRAVGADGRVVVWQRDNIEMFAFHCEIPADVKQIEVSFDDAAEPATTSTSQLARVKWNRMIMYPRGLKSDDIQVTASLRVPAGWKYATALPLDKESGDDIKFKSVSLTTLVDSPAIIGRFFKKVQLSDSGPMHEMAIAADSAEALEYKAETLAGWKEMVRQGYALFGVRHYNSYRFLLTLSDHGGDEGLEHHESSEDGVGEKALSNKYALLDLSDLLGHEYVHSWNGKHRRPARLATPDFERPMQGDLLWVYEGMTEYLGKVLPTRSKLWSPDDFREAIADYTAGMDNQSGRHWRPLADTARAVQFTYSGNRGWRNARRGSDYYNEGALVWLDADILIRQKSGGKLSLDDFCRKFHGPNSSPNSSGDSGPVVKPYELDEIITTLNYVVPHDWKGFFNERVYTVNDHAPMGITNGGWKLVFTDKMNSHMEMTEKIYGIVNLFYSIGILTNSDGEINDIVPESAAGKAGLAPGMTIKEVNGEEYSVARIRQALTDARKNSAPIALLIGEGGYEDTYNLNYHNGNLYPHLVRDNSKPDLLSDVIKSR